jgi:Ca-activated chloride channel family protein
MQYSTRQIPRRDRGGFGPATLWLALFVGALAGESPVIGQGAPGKGSDSVPAESSHTEIEEVRLVLLPTVVTDSRGRPVRGLSVDEFTLVEEGVPQQIRVFATEDDAPVSLAFLLDVSASMGLRGQLEEAKRAIAGFVEVLSPEDRFGLIGFADDQVTWITPFTDDRARFLRRLEVQDPGGRTALFDALAESPGMLGEESRGRRAIVLFTDGFDNASTVPVLDAVWTARRVRVPVYSLSFVPMRRSIAPRRVRDSLATLERVSEETGGRLYAIHDERDLDRAIAEIQAELRFQYVIGYYPGRPSRGGEGFRRVELAARRERLTVRTRTGYYPAP